MGFILRSPFGRTMIAIRENERRSRFLGIQVERHIWIAVGTEEWLCRGRT
jgi:branched-chain amino acid transport system permease protein